MSSLQRMLLAVLTNVVPRATAQPLKFLPFVLQNWALGSQALRLLLCLCFFRSKSLWFFPFSLPFLLIFLVLWLLSPFLMHNSFCSLFCDLLEYSGSYLQCLDIICNTLLWPKYQHIVLEKLTLPCFLLIRKEQGIMKDNIEQLLKSHSQTSYPFMPPTIQPKKQNTCFSVFPCI